MSSLKNKKAGFTFIFVFIIIILLLIIGWGAYMFFSKGFVSNNTPVSSNASLKTVNSTKNFSTTPVSHSPTWTTGLDGVQWSDFRGKMDWDAAVANCADLGARLPTIEELVAGLVNQYFNKYSRSGLVSESFDTYGSKPGGFDGSRPGYWADESLIASYYGVYVSTGFTSKSSQYNVRCVKSDNPPILTSKIPAQHMTYIDYAGRKAEITWYPIDMPGGKQPLSIARAYCRGIGKTLPMKEQLLAKFKEANSTPNGFQNDTYWSIDEAPTLTLRDYDDYNVNMKTGAVGQDNVTTASSYTRCVNTVRIK
jgi:hypothetical protein